MATLGDKAVGDIIKIKENEELVDYRIIHKGLPSDMYDSSCDGVWLLRRYALPKMMWDADNQNDYENSDINAWLNSNYLNTIDSNIRTAIKTVKIPFKKGIGSDETQGILSGASGLSCKVFLLSAHEVGHERSVIDGAKLSYFSDETLVVDRRKCGVNYWLRTVLKDDYKVEIILTNGAANYMSANDAYAVRPAFILPATLELDSDGNIVPNSAPAITSDKSGDLGTLEDGFVCNYSVDDADAADSVTVTLTMDSTTIQTFTAVKGRQYTYTLAGTDWLKITNGQHTFTIAANDGKDTATSTATFTRNCTSLSTTLITPLPANDNIIACTLKVVGVIPSDAVCLYEVTNNANDPEPVWEDCTEKSKAGLSYVFANKTAENGFAFNFRVSIERGASGVGGYITEILGGYE